MNAPKGIVLALDIPEKDAALRVLDALKSELAMVKVGLEGFVGYGPQFVREVVQVGVPVFLDLKLHDIPRTAAAAAREVSKLGVGMLTIHAAGGAAMVEAVKNEVGSDIAVVAVTVLTSFDEIGWQRLQMGQNMENMAYAWGVAAIDAGADGLVCSAYELKALQHVGGAIRVVPGLRLNGDTHADQKRVATPEAAARDGATHLVMGRPILNAIHPLDTLRQINQQIATQK